MRAGHGRAIEAGRAALARVVQCLCHVMTRCVPCAGVPHVHVLHSEAWHVTRFVCRPCSGLADPWAGVECVAEGEAEGKGNGSREEGEGEGEGETEG